MSKQLFTRVMDADLWAKKNKEFEADVEQHHKKIGDADSKGLDFHHGLKRQRTGLFSVLLDRVTHTLAHKDFRQSFFDYLPQMLEFAYKYALHLFEEKKRLEAEIEVLNSIIAERDKVWVNTKFKVGDTVELIKDVDGIGVEGYNIGERFIIESCQITDGVYYFLEGNLHGYKGECFKKIR